MSSEIVTETSSFDSAIEQDGWELPDYFQEDGASTFRQVGEEMKIYVSVDSRASKFDPEDEEDRRKGVTVRYNEAGGADKSTDLWRSDFENEGQFRSEVIGTTLGFMGYNPEENDEEDEEVETDGGLSPEADYTDKSVLSEALDHFDTQAEVADFFGVSPSTISHHKNN